MEEKPRYKYAIVRVKETSVVDFFGLIASQGYSEVSFVSNLSQAISRPDPNDDGEVKDTKHDDRFQIADSEDRCSASGTPQSQAPGSDETRERREQRDADEMSGKEMLERQLQLHHLQHIQQLQLQHQRQQQQQENKEQQENESEEAGNPLMNSHLSKHIATMLCKTEPQQQDESDVADIAAAASSDLLSTLFVQHKIPMSITEWSSEQVDSPGLLRTPIKHMNHHAALQQHQLSNQSTPQFQTRMKGWQREYIKDVINNGHYPSEEELRDIEQKCDLSRKQVLRFIAKRMANPNRKPRADWRSERAVESVSPQTKVESPEEPESISS